MIDQGLKIAVFIDFDNIEIGVKTTLHTQFDIAAILDGIKERGEVVTKVAYGDWKRAGDYGRLLSQHAIRMVQRNLTPGGDKNGADINLALDALEMAFTHKHINAFVIVGGDSDFITLVEKLKQYDKKVFVVGGRQFTSQVMQKNCHEFIAYENLVGGRRPSVAGPKRENGAPAAAPAPADVGKVIPLVKRALKVLADREVSPQLGLLKSTLLQLDSTFSERDYGVSTFRDFIEKIAKTGIITLRHSGRSMLVDAAEGAMEGGDSQTTPPAMVPATDAPAAEVAPPTPLALVPSAQAVRDPEQIQQIIAQTKEAFGRAAQPPRWPMYVRQLKQYLRSADPTFRRAQVGLCHDHGIPARVPARRIAAPRARSSRADSRLPGLGPAAGVGDDAVRRRCSRRKPATSWKASRGSARVAGVSRTRSNPWSSRSLTSRPRMSRQPRSPVERAGARPPGSPGRESRPVRRPDRGVGRRRRRPRRHPFPRESSSSHRAYA